MLIKVEPAGFFMHSVQMIFDLENPDAEDAPVRDYLADHELEPRHQSTGEYAGRQCEVMQFGGCYLGRHLQQVGQLQRHAVERELIAAELESQLTDLLPELAAAMPGLTLTTERRQELIAALTAEFHREESFQPNDSGELAVVLDVAAVAAAARRLLVADGARR